MQSSWNWEGRSNLWCWIWTMQLFLLCSRHKMWHLQRGTLQFYEDSTLWTWYVSKRYGGNTKFFIFRNLLSNSQIWRILENECSIFWKFWKIFRRRVILKEVFLPLSLSVFLLAFDEFQQKGALFLSRFIQDPFRVRLGAVVVRQGSCWGSLGLVMVN